MNMFFNVKSILAGGIRVLRHFHTLIGSGKAPFQRHGNALVAPKMKNAGRDNRGIIGIQLFFYIWRST
jgi:hypothetical protein